jgi:hypothetical protein
VGCLPAACTSCDINVHFFFCSSCCCLVLGTGGGTKGTQLREVLLKPPVPLEHWAYYMFELSIDGFGQPWR